MLRSIVRGFWLLLAATGLCLAPAGAKEAKDKPTEHYVFGKLNTPTPGPVSGGLLLMGGGDRNIDAMKWFFGKAGNGHIVVISASYGKEIGQEFFHDIGGIQSTEIFVFHARSQATNKKILDRLKKADGIIVSGTRADDPRVRIMQDADFPFVTYGTTIHNAPHAYVDADNEQMIRL